MSTPEFQKLDREWQPKLAAAADEIAFNPGLFKRIETVYQALPTTNLTPEQQRLTSRTYDNFVRRGARLTESQKARLSEYNQALAALFSDFSTKVLADEDTWTVLDREADLAGLPASLVSAAKAAAEERKLAGKWVVVNTRSSVDPFLMFSTRRDLRERVWKKFKSRGDNGDANDTKSTIAAMVKLRADRARLLGLCLACALADVRHDGRRSKGGAGADDERLAGGCRPGEGRSRRHAGDRREGRCRERPSSRGTTCITRRRFARPGTTSTRVS